MFPLSVDGIEIVASLVLLADKRAGRSSGWLPWAALVAGTGTSFAANMAVGGADWIGRAVSGWPAFALLVAVKLLFGLLDHPAAASDRDSGAGQLSAPGTVPSSSGPAGVDVGDGRRADGPGTVPKFADDGRDGLQEPESAVVTSSPQPVSAALDVAELMPVAREARERLAMSGTALTREALARQMRADGYAASNARVSALLKGLIAESAGEVSAVGRGGTARLVLVCCLLATLIFNEVGRWQC
ncbi:hypothetical protein [Paractinoplanes brasiliensis]|uniref:DUF2637 domain-containing protein n=1 Tax=Paractinoplanes brasiliensis TaxID=52695 RepID=A0A4R6JSD7_9ACTN|nr:hypothetical protein [Actinoplanes brasiliensis]TDO39007.1 hypothetical protein C8E87_2679 [Actinoplanes brasiliensis]GID33342.1 hypothetical protein Abr02nite_83250 [Actinoplanes brasiliensis]